MIEPQPVLRNMKTVTLTPSATDVQAVLVPHEVPVVHCTDVRAVLVPPEVVEIHQLLDTLTPFERVLLAKRFGLWARDRRSLKQLATETGWRTIAVAAAVDVALWKLVLAHGIRPATIASVTRRCRRVSLAAAFITLFSATATIGWGKDAQRLLVRIEMPPDAIVAPRTEVMLSLGPAYSINGILTGPPEPLPWNVLSMASPVVYNATNGWIGTGTIPTSIGPVTPLSVDLYIVDRQMRG